MAKEGSEDRFTERKLESGGQDTRGGNKPYMAHVMKLANLLVDAAIKREEVAEYLQGTRKLLIDKGVPGWPEFQNGALNEENLRESAKLATDDRNADKIFIEENLLYLIHETLRDLPEPDEGTDGDGQQVDYSSELFMILLFSFFSFFSSFAHYCIYAL